MRTAHSMCGALSKRQAGGWPRRPSAEVMPFLAWFLPVDATADSAGPGRLRGGDRHRAGGGGRQDLPEIALLPLEDEGRRGPVLAQRVELHRTLHGGQRDAAVQVADDLGVAGAAGGNDRL